MPSSGDSDRPIHIQKSFGPRLYECASSERPSELIAMHAPHPTSPRAGAPKSPKSDPYYERRVVSSPSARYAGSPSLRNPSSPSIQRSPSYYQYGPAQPPAHWLRDDVTYARPAPPRHPLLTQMISDVGSGGNSGGGGGFWSRGGSIPLMYCSCVGKRGRYGRWPNRLLALGSLRRDLALREAAERPCSPRRLYSCWRLRWCGLLLLVSTTLQSVVLGGQLSGAPSCSAFAQAASFLVLLFTVLALWVRLPGRNIDRQAGRQTGRQPYRRVRERETRSLSRAGGTELGLLFLVGGFWQWHQE